MPPIMTVSPELLRQLQLVVASLAVVGGLQLLFRGLRSYLRGGSLSSVGTSSIASLSAGLVRVTGTVEAPITMQSYYGFPCVYYRAEPQKEEGRTEDETSETVERSIEFDVRDESGRIHVLPHGAQWDVRVRDLQPEARIEDGDRVTVVGSAVPFGQIQDPGSAEWLALDDPVIAADLEAARAAGELEPDPRLRYGNLGIPGFALGRPESAPKLDPGVPAPAVYPRASATPGETAPEQRATRPAAGVLQGGPLAASFAPSPETLILAAVPGSDLLIAEGDPVSAASLDQWEFLAGLVGAVLAIGGAVLFALTIEGWLA
jgi:hypothetical protein